MFITFTKSNLKWVLLKYAVINKQNGLELLGTFFKAGFKRYFGAEVYRLRQKHIPGKVRVICEEFGQYFLAVDADTKWVQYHHDSIDNASDLPDAFWQRWAQTHLMPNVELYRKKKAA